MDGRSAQFGGVIRRIGGWLALAISLSLYLFVSRRGINEPLVGHGHLRYFDLHVYRAAAVLMEQGRSMYRHAVLDRFHFTYPPISVILMAPLSWGSRRTDEFVVGVVNIGALLFIARWAIDIVRARDARRGSNSRGAGDAGPERSSRAQPWLDAGSLWSLAALMTSLVLWLEPVSVALGYGQIDPIITALIVFDISRPDTARTKGAAIGLAAGMKLTPLMFIPYLLLSGRRRAALVAGGVFLTTIAVGFALLPSDAAQYWGLYVFKASRVGPLGATINQSLQGMLLRLTGAHALGAGAMALIAAITLVGLGVAVLYSRRGDEAAGFSLCAITQLLASPVSWTHHWMLVVPSLIMIAHRAYARRSRWLAVGVAAGAIIGYSYLPERGFTFPSGLGANVYVLAGLLTIACAYAAYASIVLRDIGEHGLLARLRAMSTRVRPGALWPRVDGDRGNA